MVKSKPVKSTGKPRPAKFSELLKPDYLLFCEYALVADDQTVSFIRLIEQASASGLPVVPPRFAVAAEFTRRKDVDENTFAEMNPFFRVELENPSGKIFTVGEYPVNVVEKKEWNIHRLILDMSMSIQFNHYGAYIFRISGKTQTSDYEQLLEKSFVIQKM